MRTAAGSGCLVQGSHRLACRGWRLEADSLVLPSSPGARYGRGRLTAIRSRATSCRTPAGVAPCVSALDVPDNGSPITLRTWSVVLSCLLCRCSIQIQSPWHIQTLKRLTIGGLRRLIARSQKCRRIGLFAAFRCGLAASGPRCAHGPAVAQRPR
jgi:hypothetical protein